MITVLAGGVGAARMLAALALVHDPADTWAVANVGDDLELHGLHISPDLDTITYTLAGAINPDTGWGLARETWQAMDTLRRYGGQDWFGLGDRDLGTHLYRTQRLAEGATLTEVTAEITGAWGLEQHLLPVTEDRLRTRFRVAGEGGSGGEGGDGEISFQQYFVQRRHDVPVQSVRFAGAASCRPGPDVLRVLADAERIVIAPSNPLISIDPVLAVPGVRQAVEARRDAAVAVSPIIAGAAVKGPADRLLAELGHEASVVGVARLYSSLAATLVIDHADAELAPAVEAEGMGCVVTGTVMFSDEASAGLARTVLGPVAVP